MKISTFLRSVGLLPERHASKEEVAQADTENAVRENTKAFEDIKEAYQQIPKVTDKFKTSVLKSNTPFADFENLMRNKLRDRDRDGNRKEGTNK